MEKLGLILDTDSYKFSHWKQYPPQTMGMYSYFESRGGTRDNIVFFGLQYYLKKYLSKPIEIGEVENCRRFASLHGVPFNYEGWLYIVNKLGGVLPVTIKAVPEGSIVPTKNILLSVESNDPQCFWITSWLETLLVRLWYPITVATNSYYCKKLIKEYLDKTSDNPDSEIAFKLHDFGSRGSTSTESAMIGGAAHLVNFMGSDTLAGIYMANEYYNCKMSGYSIPAAEHSTMTMWGRENEVEAYRNMIAQYGNENIFACVSDSYDIYNATINLWGDKLREDVQNMRAVLVVRPDSGNPPEVVCKLLKILDARFGCAVNSKGFRVLNKVRVIQGDGITFDSMGEIMQAVVNLGYSITNVAFGMGAGLLQKNMDRDTHRFAFKCSSANIGGRDVDVYKQPITDSGKNSKRGKLDLELINEEYNMVTTVKYPSVNSIMRKVYENGKILIEDNFEAIRKRTEKPFERYTGWKDREI